MIKVLKTDTIIDIISKINQEGGEEIILEFPFGHPILHNYLSLKILKNKCGNRSMKIITSDMTSRKIGSLLGIQYSIVRDAQFHEEKSTQKRLLSYNFTFVEYALFELRKYWRETKDTFKEHKGIKYYSLKYEKQKSRIGFFIFGLIISLFLFIFIFYFAVTKTYVSIAPEVKIKTRGKNIVFVEAPEETLTSGNNTVALRKISKIVQATSSFGATGVDVKDIKKSTGNITLYNYLPEPVQLKERTRLQNASGAVFVTTQKIELPNATLGSDKILIPSSSEVTIESDIKDINGRLIGSESNISTGELLMLPGLKENKDKIYGKALTLFEGGKSYEGKRIVLESDIDNAKKLFRQKLRDKALRELKEQIKKENELNNVTYDLIGIDNSLLYSDENIIVPDSVVIGKTLQSFDIRGSIKLEGFIFNKDSIVNKLKSVVAETTIEGSEKILLINDKSLRFATLLSRKDQPLEFKATMEIDAFIVHDFLNDNDAYVQRLKDIIAGMTAAEAKKILLNDPKISNASIEITPFFINTISTRTKNIIFKVNDKVN